MQYNERINSENFNQSRNTGYSVQLIVVMKELKQYTYKTSLDC